MGFGVTGSFVLAVLALTVTFYTQPLPAFIEREPQALVGAYHLHSDQSHDSRVSQRTYVEAAKALGLDFIVLTDHNARSVADLVAQADDKAVCVLASAELSTSFGHVVALGARTMLSAEQRADLKVLDHIDAQQARAIVAHPSDGKRPWMGPYPETGGVEIANWSASVRRQGHKLWPLGPLFTLAWLANTPLVLAQAYDRDDVALAIWDAPQHQALHGFCALDAHGWIAPQDNLSGWHMVLGPSARATPMAHAHNDIMTSLRGGHFFCAAGLLGRAPAFAFVAQRHAHNVASHGDIIAQQNVDCLSVIAPKVTFGQTRLVVYRDGQVITDSDATTWRLDTPSPGVYRVEVWAQLPQVLGRARLVPVIYSNKLTVTA